MSSPLQGDKCMTPCMSTLGIDTLRICGNEQFKYNGHLEHIMNYQHTSKFIVSCAPQKMNTLASGGGGQMLRFRRSDIVFSNIAQYCTMLHNIAHKEVIRQNDQGTGPVQTLPAANNETQRRTSPGDSTLAFFIN